MDDSVRRRTLYLLDGGYKITQVIGNEEVMSLRDKSSNLVAVIGVNKKEILSVKPHEKKSLSNRETDLLHGIFDREGYTFGEKVAHELGLSVISTDKGKRQYLSDRELDHKMLAKIFAAHEKLLFFMGNIKRKTLSIPPETRNCTIVLNNAKIGELAVGDGCMLNINARGNESIKAMQIKNDFAGTIDASESSLRKISIGDFCHCEFLCAQSLSCLNMEMGKFFGGRISIEDSCFHHLDIGHHCDANIVLRQNDGRRRISIAAYFKGSLEADCVCAKHVDIGKNCKGSISISNTYGRRGVGRLDVGEGFSGRLNLSNAVSRVELGRKCAGKLNLLNCSRIKIVKFDEDFSGEADLSYSSVIYTRAKKGLKGNINLSHCRNLTLLKLPNDKRVNVRVDKEPLGMKTSKNNVYCRYHDLQLPARYFTPLYQKVCDKIRDIFAKIYERE